MTLRRAIECIFRGRYESANVAPPTLEFVALESLARRALFYAGRPDFADPRHIAVMLGFKILPRAPRGMCGEGSAAGVIAYQWDADSRVRGLRAAHGLAHAILTEEIGEHSDADAWLLTAMLVVPPWAMGDRVIEHRFAPAWFVDAWRTAALGDAEIA